MYVPGYLTNKLMPSTAEAMTAKRSADNDGAARSARDLHAIILRILREDEEVYTPANIRKSGITSFSWKIVSRDGTKQEQAIEIQNRLKLSINRILEYAWERSLIGILAMEFSWNYDSGAWIPQYSRKWTADNLNWNPNPELIEEYLENGNKRMVFSTVRENYILAVDGDVPGGSLRRLVLNRTIQSEMLREWANYNAMIKGLVAITVNDTANEEEVAAAKNAIASIQSRNYSITGDGTALDFKDMVSSNGATSFSDLIDRLDKRCSKVILGQANTSELPNSGGSRAALTVQKMITTDILLDDMLKCESLINDQLLKFYWIKNTGSSVCPFDFVIEWQEEIDPEARIAVVDTMLRNNIPLRADEVYASTGYSKPDDAPDVFKGGSANGGF